MGRLLFLPSAFAATILEASKNEGLTRIWFGPNEKGEVWQNSLATTYDTRSEDTAVSASFVQRKIWGTPSARHRRKAGSLATRDKAVERKIKR